MSLHSQSGQIAHPTPAPGQYILKSLHFCHAKVSICNGCAQQLKPGRVILPVPNDLGISNCFALPVHGQWIRNKARWGMSISMCTCDM